MEFRGKLILMLAYRLTICVLIAFLPNENKNHFANSKLKFCILKFTELIVQCSPLNFIFSRKKKKTGKKICDHRKGHEYSAFTKADENFQMAQKHEKKT